MSRAPGTLAISSLWAASPLLAQPALHWVAPPPGGSSVTLNCLSSDGSAVVGRYVQGSRLRPLRWTATEGSIDVGGSLECRAEAICCSGGGQVVMGYGVFADRTGAWRWTAESGVQPLPPALNYYDTVPRAISEDGLVFTGYQVSSGVNAFRGTDGYGYERVPYLGNLMMGLGLSSDGSTIVGVFDGGSTRSFIWRSTTGSIEIPVGFPFYYANIEGISADGRYVTGSSGSTACRYDIDAQALTPLYWTDGSPVAGTGLAIDAEGATIAGVTESGAPFIWFDGVGARDLREYVNAEYGFDIGILQGITGMSDDGGVVSGNNWVLTLRQPQPYQGRPPCQGDVDGDGRVGLSDLVLVLGQWRRPEPNPAADLSGDGIVDPVDLNIVLVDFGDDCARRRIQTAGH